MEPDEYQPLESQTQPAREILEYVEVPLRRPLVTLLPIVIALIGAVLMYLTTSKRYQSSTLILVESSKAPSELIGKSVVESTRERLRALKQEILSRTRIERIINELEPYPKLTGNKPMSDIVERMRRSIEINLKGRDAFYVSYTHQNPYLAMAVTNRLVTLFIEEANEAREQQIAVTNRFIDDRLEEARLALENKERAVTEFRMKNRGSLPENLGANLQTLERLQLEKQTLGDNLAAAQERRIVLERMLSEELVRIGQARGEPTRPGGVSELSKLEQQLAELRTRYTGEHPDIRRLARRIERLKAQHGAVDETSPHPGRPSKAESPRVRELKSQLQELELDTAGIRREQRDVAQRIAEFENRVTRAAQVEEELKGLTRDFAKLQSTYDTWLGKQMNAELAENLERQWSSLRFRMIDPADLPERPVSPKLMKFVAAGLMAGLMAGLGLAFAFDFLDHSIKNERQLKALLSLPYLETVPHARSRRSQTQAEPFSLLEAT